MFDAIEKLKSEFTDKYVVVDAGRPELARFAGLTGRVKTVNMSGKALVEFDGRNNIGWYDIGLDFLKVVPKPEPKADDEKHGKKAAPAAKSEAPKAAEAKPAATGEKKPSVLEMLKAQAAAKAGGAAPAAPAKTETAKPEAKAEAAPAKAEVAKAAPAVEKPAEAAKPAEAPAGEKKKLSTAEILASLKKKP